jgi:hypothetical protein
MEGDSPALAYTTSVTPHLTSITEGLVLPSWTATNAPQRRASSRATKARLLCRCRRAGTWIRIVVLVHTHGIIILAWKTTWKQKKQFVVVVCDVRNMQPAGYAGGC